SAPAVRRGARSTAAGTTGARPARLRSCETFSGRMLDGPNYSFIIAADRAGGGKMGAPLLPPPLGGEGGGGVGGREAPLTPNPSPPKGRGGKPLAVSPASHGMMSPVAERKGPTVTVTWKECHGEEIIVPDHAG